MRTLQELVQKIDLPHGCGHILKARRFNRKVRHQDGSTEWCPSLTAVLSFSGQVLPNHVYCCYASLPVIPYLLPTIQCFSCCRFGHVKDKCRSKPRCFKCGQSHSGNVCLVNQNEAFCILCTGQHFATDQSCPEMIRQKQIKKKMSEDNMSYSEATTLFPPVYRSYSDVARVMFTQPQSQPINPVSQTPSTAPNQLSSRTSYRRTYYSNPRPRPTVSSGFDRAAHQALISQYNPPSPQNGIALRDNNSHSVDSDNDNLIDVLLSTLINIISRFDDFPPPSNVALKLSKLIHIANKIPVNTVEQP